MANVLCIYGAEEHEGLARSHLLVHVSGQARRARYDEQRFAVAAVDPYVGQQSRQRTVNVHGQGTTGGHLECSHYCLRQRDVGTTDTPFVGQRKETRRARIGVVNSVSPEVLHDIPR